jgi:integrase
MGIAGEAQHRVSKSVGKRRQKGTGGLVEVRPGVWKVDIEVGRDPDTGRRRRVTRKIEGTRQEAEIVLARLRVADHEKRLPTPRSSPRSVRAAFDQYIQAIEVGVIEMAPRSLVTVRSAANVMSRTVLPDARVFGEVRLGRLGWQDIEYLYLAMKTAGHSTAWIRRCATTLAQTLELARKRGLIDSNPAKDAARPRTVRTKPAAPSQAEMRALIDVVRARDEEIADAVVVLAATGMRKGELLALRWTDVDLGSEEVHVAASVSDGGRGVGIIRKETKRSDWRDVPLTTGACDALVRQLGRHRTALGREPLPDGYVFAGSPDGSTLYRPDTFTDRFTALRGASTITLRDVRHYSATRMLDAGESFRTVADILGNSENTLRLHYDGRVDVGKRKAIEALEL